jgi:Fe-S oxidoreductase
MEYENVLNGPDVRTVADHTMDLHEFLWYLHEHGLLHVPMKPINRHVNVHFHCHTLVQKVEQDVKNVLNLIPNLQYNVVEKGCCGVGGSYGFIKGNFENSMKIGSDLFNEVRESTLETYSTGESCRMQLEQGSGKNVRLTTELIAESFGVS